MTSKVKWKSVDPSKPNGQYMPEGTNVIMYNENTNEMKIGLMYSSMGYCQLQGVTHWMPTPEPPTK